MSLEDLCSMFLEAKEAEQLAKENRLDIERQIIEMAKPKLEGTSTKVAGNFKLTTTGKLNRSLDYESYLALALPENLQFVDLKPAINLKRLRAIEMVDPSIVAMCVTTKPAKPSISVEVV